MAVRHSLHAALAALLGAALAHAAWAQPQPPGEGVEHTHVSSAETVPARAAERSELWILIDAQRRQPHGAALPAHDYRRLTPAQRLELREQVRRAYDRQADRPAPEVMTPP